jgi:hypothetical protein
MERVKRTFWLAEKAPLEKNTAGFALRFNERSTPRLRARRRKFFEPRLSPDTH